MGKFKDQHLAAAAKAASKQSNANYEPKKKVRDKNILKEGSEAFYGFFAGTPARKERES